MASYEKQLHWKAYKEKKLADEIKLQLEKDLQECTFRPRVNSSSPRQHANKKIVADETSDEEHQGLNFSAADSIRLHIERQQQARSQIEFAKKRVTTQVTKKFQSPTKPVPFQLSTGNKRKEETLPASRSDCRRDSSPMRGAQDKFVELLEPSSHQIEIESWIRERTSLISIIEAQREDLKQRERAQHTASKISKRFATAVLAYEERLVAIEEKSNVELESLKQQINQQNITMEKILKLLRGHFSTDVIEKG